MHTYLGISLTEHTGTYFQVKMNNIALCTYLLYHDSGGKFQTDHKKYFPTCDVIILWMGLVARMQPERIVNSDKIRQGGKLFLTNVR